MVSIQVIVLVLCIATQAHSTNFIYEELANYVETVSRPDLIPQSSRQTPVKLSVDVFLINVNHVNLETRDVGIEAWVSMMWDGGIAFDPESFENLDHIRLPHSKVWLPDVTVYNGDLTLPQNDFSNNVVLYSTGSVLWVPKTKIRVVCNVTEVAMETGTTCTFKIGSWTHSSSQLSLKDSPKFDVDSYLDESRFEVLSTSAAIETKTYPCCEEEYQHILFSFTFRKK